MLTTIQAELRFVDRYSNIFYKLILNSRLFFDLVKK